jgi:23S rRNA pseudouridine2605 synthase
MPAPRRPTRSDRQPARTYAGGTVSLARALSKLGVCSRAQAEVAIREGRVTVDGRKVTDSSRRVVPERADIVLDGARAAAQSRVYLMINKPRGLVTTRSDPRGRETVYGCLPAELQTFVAPVGRLDQASEGLLVFTNDTQWGNAISAPSSAVLKTYHVQIDRVPDDVLLAAMRAGIATPDGTLLRAARVDVLRSGERHGWLVVELAEGQNRQIRRMLEGCNAAVLRLVRVAIGPLQLGQLPKGASRALTRAEVDALAMLSGRAVSSGRQRGHSRAAE